MGILEDIKSLRIQGATDTALALLDYMESFGMEHGYGKEFIDEADRVWRIRPTAVVAYNAMRALMEKPSKKTIGRIREKLSSITHEASKSFYMLVKDFENPTFMLHCHSTEVVEALKYSSEKGLEITAYVTETRPKEQGHKTAVELADAGIDVKFIVDAAAAFFMDSCDFSVVGSDSLRKEGVVNKIGTLDYSIVSRYFGKPFIILSSVWKIDRRQEFEIEFRDPEELGFSHEGVEVLNPAFDITPWRNVSYLVLEDEILPDPGWGDVDVLEIGL